MDYIWGSYEVLSGGYTGTCEVIGGLYAVIMRLPLGLAFTVATYR